MRKGINIFGLFIFVIVFIIECTACVASYKNTEPSRNPVSSSRSSVTGSPVQSTFSSSKTSKTNNSTQSAKTTESASKTDKQIVEGILIDIGWSESDINALHFVDDVVRQAEEHFSDSERYLGSVTSEENARKKAEVAWLYTDESKGIMHYKPFYIEFYDKYGVWFVEEGLPPNVPGEAAWIMIRGSDGKVLAVF